jgi:hypothetical protein
MYKTAYFDEDEKFVTHTTVTEITARPENVGHKLHNDSFSPLVLFDTLHTKAINC